MSYVGQLDSRPIDTIDLVVIHCTELPDLEMAREFGEKIVHTRSQTGNCGHFYIDRDGSTEEWVPLDRVAHHVRGRNQKTIGIELVNEGRYPNWFYSDNQHMTEPYPPNQIQALIGLLHELTEKLPGLARIAGHEDLDSDWVVAEDNPKVMIKRKLDPGIHFPWRNVLSEISLERDRGKD